MLRPGIVGMRGSKVIRLRPSTTWVYPHPPRTQDVHIVKKVEENRNHHYIKSRDCFDRGLEGVETSPQQPRLRTWEAGRPFRQAISQFRRHPWRTWCRPAQHQGRTGEGGVGKSLYQLQEAFQHKGMGKSSDVRKAVKELGVFRNGKKGGKCVGSQK